MSLSRRHVKSFYNRSQWLQRLHFKPATPSRQSALLWRLGQDVLRGAELGVKRAIPQNNLLMFARGKCEES